MIGWGEAPQRPPEDVELLRRFCRTLAPRYARELLTAHPELLLMATGEAYGTVSREIATLDVADGLRWKHRLSVLRAAVIADPESVFTSFIAPDAGTDTDARLEQARRAVLGASTDETLAAALHEYPDLLCDTIHGWMKWKAGQATGARRQGWEALAFLLHRCMRVGVAAGAAQGRALRQIELAPTGLDFVGCDSVAAARHLVDIVGDFTGPECDLAERARMLAEYPVLVSDEAVHMIDLVLAGGMPEPVHTETLFARSIITTAQDLGVEEALWATAWGRILLEPDASLAIARADEYLGQIGTRKPEHVALFFVDSGIQELQPHESARMDEREVMFTERAVRYKRHLDDLLDDLTDIDERLRNEQRLGDTVLRLRGLLHGNPYLLGAFAREVLDERATGAAHAGQPDGARRLTDLGILLEEVSGFGFDTAIGRFLDRAAGAPAGRIAAEEVVRRSEAFWEDLESSGERFGGPAVERLLRDLVLAASVPRVSPALRSRILNSQAGLLRLRYASSREIGSLDQAIMLLDSALALHERAEPDDGSWLLGNLGEALLDRYELTRDDADLGRAIGVQRDAVERARKGGTLTEPILRQFARGRFLAAVRAGLSPFMDAAVAALREAHLLTTPGSVSHLMSAETLGATLFIQAETEGDHDGVEESFALLRKALKDSAALPAHHARVRYNLARNLGMKAGPYMAEAMKLMRETLAQADGVDTYLAIASATWLGEWEGARGNWAEAASHYRAAWAQTRQVTDVQGTRAHTELHLRGLTGRSATAAFALARVGKPMEAAVVLEQGLAVLTSSALADDVRWLDRLVAAGHAGLAARYRESVAEVRRQDRLDLARLSAGFPGAAMPPVASTATGIRAVRQRLDDAVEAIQNVSGFSGFRRDVLEPDVIGGADGAPLVYLTATGYGGLALIVGTDGSIETTPLPALTEAAVQTQVQSLLADPVRGTESVGRWLWSAAMAPLLAEVRGVDRICVVPAGGLHLLPLHAAWRPDPSMPTRRRYALDDLLITYAPTSRALTAARARARAARPGRLLVVDEPVPVDGPRLPHSSAECRATLAGWSGESVLLSGEAATHDAVRAHLRDAVLAHLSCHARADIVNPAKSRLEVADHGAVTVADLLEDALDNLRLLVLSACETGRVGMTAPDEAIGFPTTVMQAGAAAVVSSLWAVPEAGTTELMVRFANACRSEATTYGEALRTAQQGVRDSTVAEKRRLLADVVPDGVAGLAVQGGGARAYARPYYWSAFAFHGADGPPLQGRAGG